MLDLLDAAFDEGLTPDQTRQLERMLHGNRDRIRFLLEYAHLQSEMYIEMMGREAHAQSLELLGKAEGQPRLDRVAAEKLRAAQRQRDSNLRSRRNVLRWNGAYAIAASTVAAMIIALVAWNLAGPPGQVVVASIDDSIDARWNDPGLSISSGTQLTTKACSSPMASS